MTDLEFDIEKVEALDFEKIKEQLQYIFKTDEDIVNFVNFLKNVQKFVFLSFQICENCVNRVDIYENYEIIINVKTLTIYVSNT